MSAFKTKLDVWQTCSYALLLLLLIFSIFSLCGPIHHDAAIYVRCGQLLLEGKTPYIDFVDINPPLIMYLNILPAFISRLCGSDIIATFNFCVFAACLVSFFTCNRLLYGRESDEETDYAGPLILTIAAFNLIVEIWGEFGGREHLFILALLPFTILRWQRWRKASHCSLLSAAAIGTAMAIGVLIRPHFALMPFVFEIYWLARTRSARILVTPEMVAALSTVLVYAGHFLLVPKAMNEAYFGRILPLVTKGYAAFGCKFENLITAPMITGGFQLFAIGLILLFLSKRQRSTLAVPLALETVAAYAAFALQAKGWIGHCLPGAGSASLFYAVALTGFLKTRQRSTAYRSITFLLIGLSICLLPWVAVKTFFAQKRWATQNELILRETTPEQSVMILTSGVPDAFPSILEVKRRFAGRYFFLFPISIAQYLEKHSNSPSEKASIENEEKRVLAELVDDLEKYKPALVLIQFGGSEEQKKSSLQTYLEKKGFLPGALASYQYIGECRDFSVMSAFKRKP